EEALVAYPALLPAVIEIPAVAAVMVDEIDGLGMGAEEARGERGAAAHEECRRTVAVAHLLRARGLGAALVRRDNEDRPATALRRLERRDQTRGARALRGRHVEDGKTALEVERLRDDAAVLPVVEGIAGGGEIEALEAGAIDTR